MTCEKIILQYLRQENPDRLSMLVRLHIMHCPRCRAEIKLLQKEMADLRNTYPFQMPRDITAAIMTRVLSIDAVSPKTVISYQWLLAGFTILFSIALVSFSDTLTEMKNFFGSDLDFPLHLVLGLLITSYASITAAVHLSRLKTIFSVKQEKHGA